MKKAKMPSLVSLLIMTLITVIIWVAFDVYRLFNQKEAPVVPENVSLPLNPVLDQAAINLLNSKLYLDDSQIPQEEVNSANQNSAQATKTSTENTPIPETISTPTPTP